MGRPREHDDQTAEALLDAAERIVESSGLDALSVRGVAAAVGTTTRAVYSLFGSKDGLVVGLGVRAFDMLGARLRRQRPTESPSADLVSAGVDGFRAFVVGHPALFVLAVQHQPPTLRGAGDFGAAANRALAELHAKVARLDDAGLLHGRSVQQAALEFHALCEGLAAVEFRCGPPMPTGREREIWVSALSALVAGFAATPAMVPG